MTHTLWDTTGREIVKALAAERRAAGALASGLALTLVVVADEQHVAEARAAPRPPRRRSTPAGCSSWSGAGVDADDRLDAEVQVGGRLGANEAVVMRMYGRLALHAESVVLPLLASDAPVVTWWHGEPPERDRLRRARRARLPADHRLRAAPTTAEGAASGGPRTTHPATLTWPGPARPPGGRCSPRRSTAHAEPADLGRGAGRGGNPSAALSPAGCSRGSGVGPRRSDSDGPGVTAVEVRFEARRPRLRIDRPDGRLATLSRTGRPDRAAAAEAPRARRPDRRGAAPAGRRPALRGGAGRRRPAKRDCTSGRRCAPTSGGDPVTGSTTTAGSVRRWLRRKAARQNAASTKTAATKARKSTKTATKAAAKKAPTKKAVAKKPPPRGCETSVEEIAARQAAGEPADDRSFTATPTSWPRPSRRASSPG